MGFSEESSEKRRGNFSKSDDWAKIPGGDNPCLGSIQGMNKFSKRKQIILYPHIIIRLTFSQYFDFANLFEKRKPRQVHVGISSNKGKGKKDSSQTQQIPQGVLLDV